MGMLTEPNQSLKREDISDELVVVDMKKTPLFTTIKKGDSPNDTLFEQPVDSYAAPKITGRPDGKDAQSGELEDPAASRNKVPARVQWFARFPAVGKIAGLTNPAGIGKKKEFPKAVTKKMIELKRDIEATTVANRDSAADDGTNGSLTRGLGKWLSTTAQTNDPVPAAYLTPSANVKLTGGTASSFSFAEEDMQALGQALWNVCGEKRDYEFPMAAALKTKITNFTLRVPDVDGTVVVSRFDGEVDDTTFKRTVDIYEGDFGTFNCYAHSFIDPTGTNTLNQLGYILAEELTEYRVMQGPLYEELAKQGGGRRAQIDAILGLVYKNPILGARVALS